MLEDAEISPENLSGGWKIESGGTDVPDHVVVKGRLKEHVSFWKDTIRAPAPLNLDMSFPLNLSLPPMSVGTTRLPIGNAHL